MIPGEAFIGVDLCHLWYAVLGLLVTAPVVAAQQYPAHRLPVGPGTVLLIPDSSSGLVIWATRPARAGHLPSPDFVGWIPPEGVGRWAEAVRGLLAGPAPDSGKFFEGEYLEAADGGRVSVVRSDAGQGSETAVVFGHMRERSSWVIETSDAEVTALLDSLVRLARLSHFEPASGVGYANPTNRRITPDRTQGQPPAVTGEPGEIWASAELDPEGFVLQGSGRILWASRRAMGQAVLAVLPGYRYRRKDGGVPERLRVYQRFRVR